MTEPLAALSVSAIIPVFNGERYLEAALASVLAQELLPLEVILVDDGSTDGSARLLDRLVRENVSGVPLVVISQENAGQSAARNAAAARARGDVLAFLDQDDLWYPDHLARLVPRLARRPGVGFAYSDFDEIDGEGNWVNRSFLAAHEVTHPRTSIVQWIANDSMVLPTATVVRTSAFRAVGGFDPQLIGYEDDDLWIRLFRAGWSSYFESHSTAVFRVHGASSSTRRSFRVSRVLFMHKVSALLPDAPELRRYYTSDVLRPRLVRAALADYVAELRAKRWDEARAVADTIDALFEGSTSRILRLRERRLLHHPRLVRRLLRWRRMFSSPLAERLTPGRRLRDGYSEWAD